MFQDGDAVGCVGIVMVWVVVCVCDGWLCCVWGRLTTMHSIGECDCSEAAGINPLHACQHTPT